MCSRNAEPNSTFYPEAEEVHSGYLFKSPPPSLLRNMKSWKRRFFVLAKTCDNIHELRYYRNDEKDTLIKSIDVSTITTVNTCPTTHPALEWICKSFKCSSCSVLVMKTENTKEKIQRDYFLIGENGVEVERWLYALLLVQKLNKNKPEPEPQNNSEERRSMSQPLPPNMNEPKSTDHNSHDTEQNGVGRVPPPLPPKRLSAPADVEIEHNEHDQLLSPSALEIKLDDSAEESSEDNDLSSRESAASAEESLLDCVTKAFNNLKTQQTSNTENESERHTLVEKEICATLNDLNGVIFTDEAGKLCVSECRRIEATCLFHRGDQILAVNDLLTYTVEDIQMYLRKLNKHEVKLTVLRCPDSIPFNSDHTYGGHKRQV